MVGNPGKNSTPNKSQLTKALTQARKANAQQNRSGRTYTTSAPGDAVQPTSLLAALQRADPMPQLWRARLPYSSVIALSNAGITGVFGTEYVFRLNSLFDPDLTSTGHQPFGFDQLALFYGSYRVHACTVSLEWHSSDADDVLCAFTVQSGQNTQSLGGSSLISQERQSVLSRNLPINGENRWKHVETFPIHKITGLPKMMVDFNPNYAAVNTANPAEQCYLRIAMGSSATTSCTVKCNVMLVFHVTLYDRTTPVAS